MIDGYETKRFDSKNGINTRSKIKVGSRALFESPFSLCTVCAWFDFRFQHARLCLLFGSLNVRILQAFVLHVSGYMDTIEMNPQDPGHLGHENEGYIEGKNMITLQATLPCT